MLTLFITMLASQVAVVPQREARLQAGRVELSGPAGVTEVPVDCHATAVLLDAELLIGCDDGRVLHFDAAADTPLPRGSSDAGGPVVSFFRHGPSVWVEIARREARPLQTPATEQAALRPAPEPRPTTTPPPSSAPPPTPTPSTVSLLAPERPANTIHVEAGARAMIPIGHLAVGLLAHGSLEWHAGIPFSLRLWLAPSGGVLTSPQTQPPGVATGGIDASFDGRFFAVGLGGGFISGTAEYHYDPRTGQGRPVTGPARFVLTQSLRIGATDGLHATGTTLIAAGASAFEFAGFEASIGVPVARGWLLLGRGAYWSMRGGYADLAMRIAVGDAAQTQRGLFFTPHIGMVVATSMAGPSVGLGIGYRW